MFLKKRRVAELPGLPEPPDGWAWVVEVTYSATESHRRLDLRRKRLAGARQRTPLAEVIPDSASPELIGVHAASILRKWNREQGYEKSLGVFT